MCGSILLFTNTGLYCEDMSDTEKFKKETLKYFEKRGWVNVSLYSGFLMSTDIRIHKSYFGMSISSIDGKHPNGKQIDEWTIQHTNWLLEHLQPFIVKYGIKKKNIYIYHIMDNNIQLFKQKTREYFERRGWYNKALYSTQHPEQMRLLKSYFEKTSFSKHVGNKKISTWTNKHTDWLFEHLEPFMKKYNIKREEINIR